MLIALLRGQQACHQTHRQGWHPPTIKFWEAVKSCPAQLLWLLGAILFLKANTIQSTKSISSTSFNMFWQKRAKTGWTASWTLSTPLHFKQETLWFDISKSKIPQQDKPKLFIWNFWFASTLFSDYVWTVNTNVYLFIKSGLDLVSQKGNWQKQEYEWFVV